MLLKRCCLLVLCMLLPCSALGGTWREEPEGMKVYFKNIEEWIFVTRESLDENIGLCTSRGYTEAEVRERFSTGTIRWEAYSKKLPDGLMRYEAWEDELTRNVWNLSALSPEERNDFMEALSKSWSTGRYRFINASFKSSGTTKHLITLGFVTNPPLRYESGRSGLWIANGSAHLVSYVQAKSRASKVSYIRHAITYASAQTRYMDWDYTLYMPDLEQECTDLSAGSDLIVNAHTGIVRLRGRAETGALVRVKWGDYDIEAEIAGDGTFTADIPIAAEGDMAVEYSARKSGLADNILVETVSVDNSKARLTLTEYPSGEVTEEEIDLAGEAGPGTEVKVQLDSGDPVSLEKQENGVFAYTFTASDFIPHTLTITASEEGLKDTSFTLAFVKGYDDFSEGVKTFSKHLSKIAAKALAADPSAYTGSFIKMEFRTTGMRYGEEGLALEATMKSGSKKYPVLLKCDGYLNDMVVDGMNVTVYGIIEAPEPGDEGLPCIRVVLLSYLRIIYK